MTELVRYGIHGICRILGPEILRIDKRNIEYIVLEPLKQPGTKFYVPMRNEEMVSKIQPIISQDTLQHLLDGNLPQPAQWIDDNYSRRCYYQQLLLSGSRGDILSTLQYLYRRKLLLKDCGQRLHFIDENFIRTARNLLDEEFSIILGLPREEIGTYIQNALLSK